jgi:hypothetical protein
MDRFQAMQQTIYDIRQSLVLLEGIPQTLAMLQTNVAMMQAKLLNISIRKRNKQALLTRAAADGVVRLLPLIKEVSGVGSALPGMAPIPDLPAIEVGHPVGRPFPTTLQALFTLSAPAINRLSMLFNDDFGIRRRDSLAQKRAMFVQFITAY